MSTSTVTSEALQLKLRQLLPSQQGFGTDLSASDTIIPIIDLTAAAEGSDVGVNLQTALNLGGATTFEEVNSSSTIASSVGFYRIILASSVFGGSATNRAVRINITDGVTTKSVWSALVNSATVVSSAQVADFVAYINAGESIIAKSDTTFAFLNGSCRQIADANGVLVNPVGFSPQ